MTKRLIPISIVVLLLISLVGSGVVTAQDEMEAPTVALTSPTQPSYVHTVYGPLTHGADFGLPMTMDNFLIFDSHSTATQAALAGEADIVGGSLVSHLLLRQAGQDFQIFCPFITQDDFLLVGRNGIETVEQLADPDTRGLQLIAPVVLATSF